MIKVFCRFLAVLLPGLFLIPAAAARGELPADSKEVAINAFMAARTLPDNVEARKLMTASLEGNYLKGKRLSPRVRSGRVVAFDYNSSTIRASGEKQFQVEVSCTWADLNELAYETQLERLTFVKVRNDWLADDIDLVKKVPFQGLPPLSLEQQKAGRGALAAAKRFAKAVVNRNPKLASQLVTQEYQNQFRTPEAWEDFLAGRSAPRYAAFDLREFTLTSDSAADVKIGLYQVEYGKRGASVAKAQISLQQGKTDWYVDDFQLIK